MSSRDREVEMMVDVLASTIPSEIDLTDERAVTQHLCEICVVADYRPSLMEPHIPEIIKRAKEDRCG